MVRNEGQGIQIMTIQGSSGKLFDHHLTKSKQNILFSNKPIKFLGMGVEVPHNTAESLNLGPVWSQSRIIC